MRVDACLYGYIGLAFSAWARFLVKPLIPVDPRLSSGLRDELAAIYKQVMWLSRQPGTSAGNARAWYTHIMAETVKRRIRQFSGMVSQAAVSSEESTLRLEHYKRIQTTLTALVERHRKLKRPRPEEFIATVLECERVHIVTFKENYEAMQAKGNYRKARIVLLPWKSIAPSRQAELWSKMLRGRVANAKSYAPGAEGGA